MQPGKVTLLSLVFAAGGGVGWLASLGDSPAEDATKTAHPSPQMFEEQKKSFRSDILNARFPRHAPDETETAPANGISRTDREENERSDSLPVKVTDTGRESANDSEFEDPGGGRSAGELLAALERAYQSQEERIARLEAAIEEGQFLDAPSREPRVVVVNDESSVQVVSLLDDDEGATDLSPSRSGEEDQERALTAMARPSDSPVSITIYEGDFHEGDTIQGDVHIGDSNRPQQVIMSPGYSTILLSGASTLAPDPELAEIEADSWWRFEKPSSSEPKRSSYGARFYSQSASNTRGRYVRTQRGTARPNGPRRIPRPPHSSGQSPRHDPWARVDYSGHNDPFDSSFKP